MASLKNLIAQRAALDKQIEQAQKETRTTVLAQIKSLMAEHGLTVADLNGRGRKATKTASQRKVAPKYRNKATGETWSGRGLQPRWLKAAIASGKKLQDFAI